MTLPDDAEVTIDRRRFAGVWANASKAIAHLDEVTIDSSASIPASLRRSSSPGSRAHRSSSAT